MLTIGVKEGAAFCIGEQIAIRFIRDGRNRLRVQIAAPKDQKILRLGFITDQQIFEVQCGRSALELALPGGPGGSVPDAGEPAHE